MSTKDFRTQANSRSHPPRGEVLSTCGGSSEAVKELCVVMKDFQTRNTRTEAGVRERKRERQEIVEREEVCRSVSAVIADKERGLFS